MYSSVKDSGKRQEFSTGSLRDSNEGKGRYDLLPTYALSRLAQHFQNGAKKYGDENWRKGQNLRRYLDSALRHAFKFLEGHRDEDHAIAAVWNLLALVETQRMIDVGILPRELDDLPDFTGDPLTGHFDHAGMAIGLGTDGSGGTMTTTPSSRVLQRLDALHQDHCEHFDPAVCDEPTFTGPDAFTKPTATPTPAVDLGYWPDVRRDDTGSPVDIWEGVVAGIRNRRQERESIIQQGKAAIARAKKWLGEN